MSKCAFCKEPIGTVNFTLHRDGFGVGPEIDLCDECGGNETPTCSEIWDRIAEPADDFFAHRRINEVTSLDAHRRKNGDR